MKKWLYKLVNITCIFSLLFVSSGSSFVYAQSNNDSSAKTLKDQADGLNDTLDRKKSRAKEIESLINTYRDRIEQQADQKLTLENQVTLLDNRIKEKELRIEESQAQIEILSLELQVLEKQITQQEERIKTQKSLVGDLIRRARQADDVNTLHVFLSRPSLSSYFNQIEEESKLQSDLTQTLERVIQEKTSLQNDKKDRENKRQSLEEQRITLAEEQSRLEIEKNSKISLLAETQNQQEQFSRVVNELRQQQESTVDDIANIEANLKDKLNAIDEALAKGETLLLWPVPVRKITATFHDPTYPFRNLFQHPGIDLRASVGTPIKAAGGGYVAWTKLGKSYGNYMMIVHPGNFATIYAHLSAFNVKAGTYVERGDIIGFTGGMPGQPGAGLSTGPHLHFEVRYNGIPVDPQGYLPVAIETE
ncbi:peptidoglycan DD-metalloendopeptidase family protein [Patescibacteria group bacterium]|nr:peptidoglycan DD-metalloendopeptidase family protein [Patescibacteria group bacterium]